jgi:hypothetical protein
MMPSIGKPTLNKLLTNPCFPFGFVLSVFFILPRYGSGVVMFACAALISAYVFAMPESFLSRGGSLLMAKCLAGGMWVLWAIVVAVNEFS